MTRCVTRCLEYLSYGVVLATLAGLVYLGVLLWPTQIIVPNIASYPVVKPTFTYGEPIRYRVDFCITKDTVITARYEFVLRRLTASGALLTTPGAAPTQIFLVPDVVLNVARPKGCFQGESGFVKVPYFLPLGVYHLRLITTARDNWLRSVERRTDTTEFEVVP